MCALFEGCKPVERTDTAGHSVPQSPCSSYQPSPYASYNPSPTSSSFPSPVRGDGNNDDALLPGLKNLSPAASSLSKRRHLSLQHFGSITAPVTPPISSPTARSPRRIKISREVAHSFMQSSTPLSPGRQAFPADPSWLAGICIPNGNPMPPTFSFVSQNPFNPSVSSRMWTPGQSGICSPVMVSSSQEHADAQMADGVCDEFAFGSSSNDDNMGMVKAWEGETIHEECGNDELELTLGTSSTRS